MKIVYNSFLGRFSDSPRAIYESLSEHPGEHRHVWLTDPDFADSFPPAVETVRFGGEGCVDALESCDLLVANSHTEVEWDKRPDTIYLQTWHGTPLKRIHNDVLWAPDGRLERLSRDVARWDILLSPNRASTPRLRGAFGFEGELIETGYPRNDLLSSPGREEVRARVREELGIADGVTAVLYTPTWRDEVVFGPKDNPFALDLDLDRFAQELGDDHCLLLRLHYMLTGRLTAEDNPAVRDVSMRPDVSDLYLAADALVTDYSSTMFDFAITGKPMVFYAYDLADYRDRSRGFYFDLTPEAPGPIVGTQDELFAALHELDATAPRYADRYARFRETYCHLEDGRATDRVLERLALTPAR